jgi:hypothetical protein
MTEQTARTHALGAAKQLVAELRSDDDWAGLYGRLLFRQAQAAAGHGPFPLPSGGTAWSGTFYYPAFLNPPGVEDLGFLVEVPPPTPPTSGGAGVLREDLSLPRFGLPADLNSDTHVDGESRDTDYLMLPVVVHVRWRSRVGGVQELQLPTWLRGER